LKVFGLRGDSLLQRFAQGAKGMRTHALRAIAYAGPKPWTSEPDLAEYRSYDNRSTILVVAWRVAAATVVLHPKIFYRLVGDDDRLHCGQHVASVLQRKAQLLEIFVRPIDDSNFDWLAGLTTLPILQAGFDDYSHEVASRVNELPVSHLLQLSATNVSNAISLTVWTALVEGTFSHRFTVVAGFIGALTPGVVD
jgi:hypothetical protein